MSIILTINVLFSHRTESEYFKYRYTRDNTKLAISTCQSLRVDELIKLTQKRHDVLFISNHYYQILPFLDNYEMLLY